MRDSLIIAFLKKSKPLLFIISCFYVTIVNAQQPDFCGGGIVDRAALAKAIEYEKNNIAKTQNNPYLLRVYFHICTFDDGTNAGATKADLDNEFATLKSDYTTNNICFFYGGLNYIKSTALDTINVDADGGITLFTPYMIPGCINVFYVQKINGTNTATGGGIGGYGVFGTGCLISKGNINKGHTISHEVGHFLGLLHTFEATTGHENIDGTNCAVSADLICDTKADPFVFNTDDCFSTSDCKYAGTCKDPNGKSDYSPPYSNMMAYWWAHRCYSDLAFSDEQFQRIDAFLVTNPAIISCESPNDDIVGFFTDVSNGNYIKSSIYTLTTNGAVNFHNTVQATLGSQVVTLEPGFHAYPSSGGIISIKATDCNYTSQSKLISETNNNNFFQKNQLKIYPNPATSFVSLQFNTIKEDNVLLELYNMSGLKIKDIKLHVSAGEQSIKMDVNNLLPGVYILQLRLNTQMLETKLMISK
jgi:hypothetical protein